jgi:hypothetical protein
MSRMLRCVANFRIFQAKIEGNSEVMAKLFNTRTQALSSLSAILKQKVKKGQEV